MLADEEWRYSQGSRAVTEAKSKLAQIRELCDRIEAGAYGVPLGIVKTKTIRSILDE